MAQVSPRIIASVECETLTGCVRTGRQTLRFEHWTTSAEGVSLYTSRPRTALAPVQPSEE